MYKSLSAFKDLDGEDWIPVIYINDLEKYYSRNPYDSLRPLYAIDDYDTVTGTQIMKGYQEDANGELAAIDEELTPSLAGEDDIIVLEMLPCVSGGGIYNLGPCGGSSGGGSPPPLENVRTFKDMTVKYHHEGWPGRSEVNLIGFKNFYYPIDNGLCGNSIVGSSNCVDQPNGKMIRQFTRSEISNQEERRVDYLMDGFSNDPGYQAYYSFVIFEQDSWPAPTKSASFPFPNNITRTLEYRSWQPYYDKQTLKDKPDASGFPWANAYSRNINSIKYNFYTY